MLDYIFRPTIRAVQCEPAPKKGAVHNPAMTTKGAGRGDIGILSPYIFERFKPPVHHCPIDRPRQRANRMLSKRAGRRRRLRRVGLQYGRTSLRGKGWQEGLVVGVADKKKKRK